MNAIAMMKPSKWIYYMMASAVLFLLVFITIPVYAEYFVSENGYVSIKSATNNSFLTISGNLNSSMSIDTNNGYTAASVTTGVAEILGANDIKLHGDYTLGTRASVFVYFQYGATAAYGSTTAEQQFNTSGSYTATVTGLPVGSHYHYRSVVRYADSYAYGADSTFYSSDYASIPATKNVLSATLLYILAYGLLIFIDILILNQSESFFGKMILGIILVAVLAAFMPVLQAAINGI
jgi:hypothetical protein